MSLNTQYDGYFLDPISHIRMQEPVISFCGHTFEKIQIDGWVKEKGDRPGCPLCNKPVMQLVPNLLYKRAVSVLKEIEASKISKIEDLTSEEQEDINAAIKNVEMRRESDREQGIPDRLEKAKDYRPKSFAQKVEECCFPGSGKK